jgi:hypothetical protein
LSGSDQILAQLVQAGGETLLRSINSLILLGIRKKWKEEELPDQWKESVIVPIYKKGDNLIVVIMMV